MALYAIGDLHLSLGADKPMDVFGPKWENYVERIRENFSRLREDDVTVLAGDTSWGISLEQALPDFRFIDALPGRKLLPRKPLKYHLRKQRVIFHHQLVI